MLAKRVTFYRQVVPAYAAIVHPGGAPQWVVKNWLNIGLQALPGVGAGPIPPGAEVPPVAPVVEMIRNDLKNIDTGTASFQDIVALLLGNPNPDKVVADEFPDAYA